MDDVIFVVYAIDCACDCCGYVACRTFDARDDADAWVASQPNPHNYFVEEEDAP
jgi:hypothetical protein